jgi:hypothetical protein
MLESAYPDLESVPEALRDHYSEVNGIYQLGVVGMKSQTDFDNFSVAIKKRLADATAQLKSAETNKLTREDMLDVIKQAAADMTPGGGGSGAEKAAFHELSRKFAAVTEENSQLKTSRDEAVSKAARTIIETRLIGAASAVGVRPEAIASLVALVSKDFETSDSGEVVVKLEGVSHPGVSPNMNPVDYLSARMTDPSVSFFWPGSTGGGADGGGGGNSGMTGADNPWTAAGWNMTKQGQIMKTDSARAEKMAAAAGVTVLATKPKAAK